MKLNLSYENKRAKMKILSVEDMSPDWDKKSAVKHIKKYKKDFALARTANDKKLMERIRKEIQYQRSLLRDAPFDRRYVFTVYVKQYRHDVKITLNFTLDKYPGVKHSESFKKFLKAVVDNAIKVARRDIKVQTFVRPCGMVMVEKSGNKNTGFVNVQENSVLKAHVKKNMKNLYDGKAPTTQKKYIGIEIEFCAPIKEEPFALKLFQRGIHKYAQLKQDGSLRPDKELKEYGFELAILLEETTYKKGLKTITDLLREVKAVAKDRRCGLHVHLDMRRRDKDLVYNNLVASQYALLSIVDPSRYNNEFCQTVTSRKIPTKFTGDRHERYKTINAAAYYKFKTLEVRMHEGSVSYEEMTHWVDMLVKIANYGKKLKDDVTELDILQKRFKFKKPLYNYALDRSCTFQIQNDRNVQNLRDDARNILRNPARQRVAVAQEQVAVAQNPIEDRLRGLRDIIGMERIVPIFEQPAPPQLDPEELQHQRDEIERLEMVADARRRMQEIHREQNGRNVWFDIPNFVAADVPAPPPIPNNVVNENVPMMDEFDDIFDIDNDDDLDDNNN